MASLGLQPRLQIDEDDSGEGDEDGDYGGDGDDYGGEDDDGGGGDDNDNATGWLNTRFMNMQLVS